MWQKSTGRTRYDNLINKIFPPRQKMLLLNLPPDCAAGSKP